MYINKSFLYQNITDNGNIKPIYASYNKHNTSIESAAIQHQLSASMNRINDNKRKPPPLKLPLEVNLLQNQRSGNITSDDDTPEYPLKEGNVFFNSGAKKQKNCNNKNNTEPLRNCFTEFLEDLSMAGTQSLSQIYNAYGYSDHSNAKTHRRFEACKNSSCQETTNRADNLFEMQRFKLQKFDEYKSAREYLTHKYSGEVSGQRQEPKNITSKVQEQINCVHKQTQKNSTFRREETVLNKSNTMMLSAQDKWATQQRNNEARKTVATESNHKHLLWPRHSYEETSNSRNYSSVINIQNYEPVLNSFFFNEKKIPDPLRNVCSLSADSKIKCVNIQFDKNGSSREQHGTTREQHKPDEVDKSANQNSQSEPLDLSNQSVKGNKLLFESMRNIFNIKQNYIMSENCKNGVCNRNQFEAAMHCARHSSANTKGEVPSSRTQLNTFHDFSSRSSAPPMHLPTKPPSRYNTEPPLQSELHCSYDYKEKTQHNNYKIYSQHLFSQVASPSTRNEHQCSVQAATSIEQASNKLTCATASTSTQFRDNPVVTCTSYLPCFHKNEVVMLTSSSKQSSLIQPNVSSKCTPSTNINSSVPNVVTQLSSVIPSSASSTTTSQTTDKAQPGSSRLPLTSVTQSLHTKRRSGRSLPRLVPLPIKDFFTQSPKENTYSSLLMAEITSRSKRRLNFPTGTNLTSSFPTQRNIRRPSVEVSTNLQRNLVIDLTEGNDDSDVVSISSKDSLDDDSNTDTGIIDVTGLDTYISPGPDIDYPSIRKVSVSEEHKNKQPHTTSYTSIKSNINYVPNECALHRTANAACEDDSQQVNQAYKNISNAEVNAHKFNKNGSKGNFSRDRTELSYEANYNNEEAATNNKIAERLLTTSTPVQSIQARSSNKLNGRESSINSNLISTGKNKHNSSSLKIVPESKHIMAAKLKNVVASRTTCGKPFSGELNTSAETNDTHNLLHKPNQTKVVNSESYKDDTTVSTHDNSTHRAAATLLELSANPLYSSYTLLPETSDVYHEKVYQVHPTIHEWEVGREQQNGKEDARATTERPMGRTGRRVGRPPKHLSKHLSDNADFEGNNALVLTSKALHCIPSNSAPSVNITTVHNSVTIVASPSKCLYSAGRSLCTHCKRPSKFSVGNENNTRSISSSTEPSNFCVCPHTLASDVDTCRGISKTSASDVDTCKGVSNTLATNVSACRNLSKTLAANSSTFPNVTTTIFNNHYISSTLTDLKSTSSDKNSGQTSVSNVYDQIMGKLPNSYDYNKPFMTVNNTSNLSSNQQSVPISSKMKRSQVQTVVPGIKRPRGKILQENQQLSEGSHCGIALSTNSFRLDINPISSRRSSLSSDEAPGEGPLRIVLAMEEISSPISELGDMISHDKDRHDDVTLERNSKHSEQNALFINEALQRFNSHETLTNVVVKTSFEDGLHVLSLQSETESESSLHSPLTGDQIVPVNKAHVMNNLVKSDTKEINKCKNITSNEKSANKIIQPPENNKDRFIQLGNNSMQHEFNDCTTQSSYTYSNNLDNEAVKEIEKERAVTSLLAEMMKSRVNGYIH